MAELRGFGVTGMHCAGCAAAVERAVRKLPGTEDIYVNFATGKLNLRPGPGYPGDAAVVAAVERAGFKATPPAPDAAVAPAADEAAGAGAQLRRFILCAVFTAALTVVCHWHFRYQPLVQLVLLIPVLIGGSGFFRRGFPALFRGAPNMDSLISCGAAAGIVYSLVLLASGRTGHLYFDAAAMILTLILCGKMLEARARSSATGAIRALLDLTPPTAQLVRDGGETTVNSAELRPGDVVRIRPGDRVPADGIVIDGGSSVNEAMLTGEELPVAKTPGATVHGGTLNVDGVLLARVTATGAESALGQIVKLVAQAQDSRAPAAALADRVAGYFVWGIFAAAAVTALVWCVVGSTEAALHHGLSALVVACPCALGLATPIALISGIGRGAALGILIKNGAALEKAAKLSAMLFDKTGTLTSGVPQVKAVYAADGDDAALMRYAAAVERFSEHPLAKAVLAARPDSADLPEVTEFAARPGFGVSGRISGTLWRFGNAAMLSEAGIEPPELPGNFSGYTLICAAADDRWGGAIAIGDTLRPEAEEAIAELRRLGVACGMLTGDNADAAAAAARPLGLNGVEAGLSPQGKLTAIRAWRERYGLTGMVGDGINDAPALAAGDLGIAVGSGSDVAMESAEVVIMRSDLREVARMVRLSRATFRVIRQNLFWAFFYNLIGVPLAAGALSGAGVTLPPAFCAGAMAASSLTVVLNALRLRRFR